MHGNVWEWVEDCWNASYAGAPTDGSAWAGGNCAQRVVRGGSWDSEPQTLRSALRYYFLTSIRSNTVGFRVARGLD
jgi:formylglycine-generating enzyme required for sulfatase activity